MTHASTGKVFDDIEQPASFEFTRENWREAERIMAKYPKGRQASAVMPLLMMAQKQAGNWLPKAAMDYVAKLLDMPPIKVYEVATFYTMYNLRPMGKFHVQVCTTTPCWLRGSDGIVKACEKHLGVGLGETSADGLFTLTEVECLGACVNAPMMQVSSAEGDAFFEDLTPGSVESLLKALRWSEPITPGPQNGRRSSEPEGGPTALASQRAEWEKWRKKSVR